MKPTIPALVAASLVTSALAEETREMEAHVHGVSIAQIAIEHGIVEINLTSPGMDIVGFEYEASSDKDKDAMEVAIRRFLTPENIVALPDAAGCRLTEVLAHLHAGEPDHEEKHGDTHAEHEHDDDHAENVDHDHESHEEGEHEEHAAHSEFHARYIFACDDEKALTDLSFPFFERFENAQEIEVQYVTETGAGTAKLTRDAAKLSFE